MAVVERPPADKPGPDIVSSILVSTQSQIERGRQEINYHSTDRLLRTGVLYTMEYVQPGVIVEIQDKTGHSRGMVTGFSLSISASKGNITSSANLIVECV